MAVEEINADGGIRGRPVRLIVGDDGTDPARGAVEAKRLVRSGCRVVLASTTSATFARVSEALRADGVLLVQALMNEGGQGGELRIRLGERPYQQLRAAAGPVMAGGGRTAVVPRGQRLRAGRAPVHASARRVVDERRGSVVGEAFAPLGTRDFTPVVEAVLASGADVVLSSFVGADLVAFERQCHAMGLRERALTLALTLDEPTRERIGDVAAAGMHGIAGYFEQLAGHRPTPAFLAPLPATSLGACAPAGREHLGVGVRGGAPVRDGRPARAGEDRARDGRAGPGERPLRRPAGAGPDARAGPASSSRCTSPSRSPGGFAILDEKLTRRPRGGRTAARATCRDALTASTLRRGRLRAVPGRPAHAGLAASGSGGHHCSSSAPWRVRRPARADLQAIAQSFRPHRRRRPAGVDGGARRRPARFLRRGGAAVGECPRAGGRSGPWQWPAEDGNELRAPGTSPPR